MTFIAPRAKRVHQARYRVEAGDTLEGIAERFGQAGAAYGELVAANLGRPLTARHVAPGASLKLAGLRPGDLLFVPASWPASAPLLGEPGSLGADNQLSPTTLKIAEILQAQTEPGAAQKLPVAWLPAVANAVSQWWEQEHTDEPAPDLAKLAPLIASARAFMHFSGADLGLKAAQVPWAALPWHLAASALKILAVRQIDWQAVRAFANAEIKPGQVQAQGSSFPGPSWALADFGAEPLRSIPWGMAFEQIPLWAFPWGKIDLSALANAPSGSSPAENAQIVIAALKKALGITTKLVVTKGAFPAKGAQQDTSTTTAKGTSTKSTSTTPAKLTPEQMAKLHEDAAKLDPGGPISPPSTEVEPEAKPVSWPKILTGAAVAATLATLIWRSRGRGRK